MHFFIYTVWLLVPNSMGVKQGLSKDKFFFYEIFIVQSGIPNEDKLHGHYMNTLTWMSLFYLFRSKVPHGLYILMLH